MRCVPKQTAEQYSEVQESRKNGLAAYFNYTILVTRPRRECASDASRAADDAVASGKEPPPATAPHLLLPRGRLTTPRPPHAGITTKTDPRARKTRLDAQTADHHTNRNV